MTVSFIEVFEGKVKSRGYASKSVPDTPLFYKVSWDQFVQAENGDIVISLPEYDKDGNIIKDAIIEKPEVIE